MRGEYRIAAGREAVWAALNEPSVLKACLEGCESFDRISDTDFKAKMTTRVGPIRTKFSCAIRLSDLDPPNSYTLSGQGDGGASGYAKGSVKVALTESGGATAAPIRGGCEPEGKDRPDGGTGGGQRRAQHGRQVLRQAVGHGGGRIRKRRARQLEPPTRG